MFHATNLSSPTSKSIMRHEVHKKGWVRASHFCNLSCYSIISSVKLENLPCCDTQRQCLWAYGPFLQYCSHSLLISLCFRTKFFQAVANIASSQPLDPCCWSDLIVFLVLLASQDSAFVGTHPCWCQCCFIWDSFSSTARPCLLLATCTNLFHNSINELLWHHQTPCRCTPVISGLGYCSQGYQAIVPEFIWKVGCFAYIFRTIWINDFNFLTSTVWMSLCATRSYKDLFMDCSWHFLQYRWANFFEKRTTKDGHVFVE